MTTQRRFPCYTTYSYDPNTGELTGLISRTLTRAYDATAVPGRNTGFSTDSSYAVTYGYDSTGRFGGVSWNVGTHSDTVQYGYEPNSHLLKSATFGSGASTGYSYETHRNLKTSVLNREHSLFINFTLLCQHNVNITIIRKCWFEKTGKH
ncbi:MAG: hypothetical protein QTN59_00215 [Candidatus Electrothrix communis]|nr:MAG: hypothetical protein QTN59_00215 [Candidatus Electrothrix communis]